jgi:hypothetical protein
MNKKQVKASFLELAKDKVPENYQPWPLLAEKHEGINNGYSTELGTRQSITRRFPIRNVGLIGLFILLVCGIFFTTPSGRVMAQNIAAFFTHSGKDWKPIPSEYNQTALPEVIAKETQIPAQTVTLQTPSEFFMFQRQKNLQEGAPLDNISREQAAEMVDYPLKEPVSLPDGYQFNYAVHFVDNDNTLLVYGYQPDPKGEMIMLTLSPTLIQDEVGSDAKIDKIKVNGFEAEMVRGGWLALAGENQEKWEPKLPVTTIRWFDGELYIKIQFHLNEPTSPAYLDLSQMLKVAESIPITANESGQSDKKTRITPTSIPSADSFCAMEEKLGYDLLEPGILPAGYKLKELLQVPGTSQIDAYYRPNASDETGPRLTISQRSLSLIPQTTPQNYPPDKVELVDIFGSQGRLIEGVNDGSGSYPSWFLFWETQDKAISLWYYPGSEITDEAAKAMLIDIAKSMK